MEKLTEEKLKEMEPGEVIDTGEMENSPEGIYMTASSPGRMITWVAVRGEGIPDWTIYCHWSEHDIDFIKRYGQKIVDFKNIKKLVDADQSAMNLYRL